MHANEAVEKPRLGRSRADGCWCCSSVEPIGVYEALWFLRARPTSTGRSLAQLRRISVVGEFLDIVDQAEELPLALDFRPAAQREAIEPFIVAQIAEHRLDDAKPLPVEPPTVRRIDAAFHSRRVRLGQRRGLALKEHDRSHCRRLRRVHASSPE